MRVLNSLCSPDDCSGPLFIAAGCFDGVHLGHQEVIRETVRQAQASDGSAWVLTFDPHPAKILNPNAAPPLLSASKPRLRHFAELGCDGCYMLPFERELAALEPEDFGRLLIEKLPNLKGIVVGNDWTFGRRARGGVSQLRKIVAQNNVRVTALEPVLMEGNPVSSTALRHSVIRGDLELAERMLGRPFSMFGRVVHGSHLGRKLGYPTANLAFENEVVPPTGIYAARAFLKGQSHPAAAYLGSRRTFHNIGDRLVLEVFLINYYEGDLYGDEMEISFLHKVRGDRKFASPKKLQARIARDIDDIRRFLGAAN